jgi:hypothetical protein
MAVGRLRGVRHLSGGCCIGLKVSVVGRVVLGRYQVVCILTCHVNRGWKCG